MTDRNDWIQETLVARAKSLELSAYAIALQCEIDPGTVKRFFNGEGRLNSEYVGRICRVLKLELTPFSDCGQSQRTKESARRCQCDACTRWWCENVPGYFYCTSCREACTPLHDQYDGICERCFDAHDDAKKE